MLNDILNEGVRFGGREAKQVMEDRDLRVGMEYEFHVNDLVLKNQYKRIANNADFQKQFPDIYQKIINDLYGNKDRDELAREFAMKDLKENRALQRLAGYRFLASSIKIVMQDHPKLIDEIIENFHKTRDEDGSVNYDVERLFSGEHDDEMRAWDEQEEVTRRLYNTFIDYIESTFIREFGTGNYNKHFKETPKGESVLFNAYFNYLPEFISETSLLYINKAMSDTISEAYVDQYTGKKLQQLKKLSGMDIFGQYKQAETDIILLQTQKQKKLIDFYDIDAPASVRDEVIEKMKEQLRAEGYQFYNTLPNVIEDILIDELSYNNVIEDVTTDPSVKGGVEVITRPASIKVALTTMKEIFKIIDSVGFTSGDTGLHVNMSIKGKDFEKDFDMVKLAVLVNDAYMQGRYPAREYVSSTFKSMNLDSLIHIAQSPNLDQIIKRIEKHMKPKKHRGINFLNALEKYMEGSLRKERRRVEFRYLGGMDYEHKYSSIENDVLRYGYLLAVAFDPEFQKKEYHKGVIKLLDRQTEKLLKATHIKEKMDFAKLVKYVRKHQIGSEWDLNHLYMMDKL